MYGGTMSKSIHILTNKMSFLVNEVWLLYLHENGCISRIFWYLRRKDTYRIVFIEWHFKLAMRKAWPIATDKEVTHLETIYEDDMLPYLEIFYIYILWLYCAFIQMDDMLMQTFSCLTDNIVRSFNNTN